MFVYSPFLALPRMNRAICGDSEMFICSMATPVSPAAIIAVPLSIIDDGQRSTTDDGRTAPRRIDLAKVSEPGRALRGE